MGIASRLYKSILSLLPFFPIINVLNYNSIFSEKLIETIENVQTEVVDTTLKKKISELKCELTENIEEDKKVAQFRKTLNTVAPLLEDLVIAEPSRKSTLKRLGMYFYKKK